MPLIALLDANVIWSAAVRDTLLLSAEHDLFHPAWSREILAEMAHGLQRKRPDLDPVRIDRTVSQMLRHFPEALIAGYEDLVPTMRNHPGDRHVLAAAVRAGADLIVTWNEGHFPAAACAPYGIGVQTPDSFLCELWDLHAEQMALVLSEQAKHLLNPPRSIGDVLDTLGRTLPHFARSVHQAGLA